MNKCKGEYCPFRNNCKRTLEYIKPEIAMESPFHPVERGKAAYCDYQIPLYDPKEDIHE